MRRLVLLSVVLGVRSLIACEAPRGLALADIDYVPDCAFSFASVAANDSGAFSAWHYTHAGFGSFTGTNYGGLLDRDGRLRGLTETQLGGFVAVPSVATDGRDYLVAFSDATSTSFSIIRADGTQSSISPLMANHIAGKALAVWTGAEYLVVSPQLVAATVSREGIAGNVNTLTTGATLMALAPAGAGRAIAIWKRGATFEAALITGTSLSSTVAIDAIPSDALAAVASNGDGFAVAFSEPDGRVAALRLDAGAHPIGAPIEIATDPPPPFRTPPQIVADGSTYLVLWSGSIIRGARLDGSAPFDIGSGILDSASATSSKTVIAYRNGCSYVATRTIAPGARTATAESIISIRAADQLTPRLAATPFGHQSTWQESTGALFTRFVASSGARGEVTRLSDNALNTATAMFEGGSVVVWSDSALRMARFDGAGNRVGDIKTLSSTHFVFSIQLAVAGGEVLVVTSGEDDPFQYEADAARVDAAGNVIDRVRLSRPGEDSFAPVAAADDSKWIVVWRNGSSDLEAIEMPHADLRQQSRTSIAVAPAQSTIADVGGVTAGPDPAILWIDRLGPHASFLHPRLDVLLSSAEAYAPRVIGTEAFWLETGATSRIMSAPITRTPAPARERACLTMTSLVLDFDTRNGEVDAVAYRDAVQVKLHLRMFPRRRAVR